MRAGEYYHYSIMYTSPVKACINNPRYTNKFGHKVDLTHLIGLSRSVNSVNDHLPT